MKRLCPRGPLRRRVLSETRVGFECGGAATGDELGAAELDSLSLLLHRAVAADAPAADDMLGVCALVHAHPGALEHLASEYTFLERVVECARGGRALLSALELTAALTNSEEVTDVLVEKGVVTVLCAVLVECELCRVKAEAMRCLHHIAAQSEANCMLMFEQTAISLRDTSRTGAPVQCVMHVVDEQVGGCSEVESYLREEGGRGLVDPDALRLRKLALKFLVALVCTKRVPRISLLSEIVEYIVKSTFEKNQEILAIALCGCVDCANNFFRFFWSPFAKNCCYYNFINILQDGDVEFRIKTMVLQVFLEILEKSPEEAEEFVENRFIHAVDEFMKTIQKEENDYIKTVWCEVVCRFLEIQFCEKSINMSNIDIFAIFVDIQTFDCLYQYLFEGTIDLKISALMVFQIVIESCDTTTKNQFLEKYTDLLLACSELLQCDLSQKEYLLCLFKILEDMVNFYCINGQFSFVESVLGNDDVIHQIEYYIINHPCEISIPAKRLRSMILNES